MSINLANNDTSSTVCAGQRRSFLKLMTASLVGVAGWTAGVGRAAPAESNQFEPLWASARVLIGNSPEDQNPSPFIECPLFFVNGQFANASHTLDLSELQTTGKVRGTITLNDNTIEPDFSASIASAVTQGTDGVQYLVVAGEGEVTGATAYLKGVNKVIIRCKYKMTEDNNGNILLISCIDCVVILVHE